MDRLVARSNRSRQAVVALGFTLVAFLAACASSGTGSRGSTSPRNVITSEQLADLHSRTALEAVERLKPTWLRTRGPESRRTFPLAVAVDGVIQGDVTVLDSYPCSSLAEIRYLDARRAMLRFGDRASGGAILLITAGR